MKHAADKNERTPRARKEELEIQEVGNELLVYDLERHRAHALGPLASLVFHRCDGRTDVQKLSRLIAQKLAIPADPELVRLVLARLAKARLLDESYRPVSGCTRRDFVRKLKRLGLVASALLPAVTSIVSPTAAHALSCVPNNGCAGMPNCTPCEGPGGQCNGVFRCCNGQCMPPGQAKSQCGC